MGLFSSKFIWFGKYYIFGLIFCMITSSSSLKALNSRNETDRLVLLDFKNHITLDPFRVMSLWNDSFHFCNWVGVTCSSPYNKRVVSLNLETKQLVGSLPPSIGNLTFLKTIKLSNNYFHGEIPQQIGRLLFLQHLNLSSNSFGGKIPTNLTHCTKLKFLHMFQNKLVGKIPDQLSSLSKLFSLAFSSNNLTGDIPAWIGNFSSLSLLALSLNNFQGSIPNELGGLSNMTILQLGANKLSGTIPASIFNVSSLNFLSVTQNQLHGQLPADIGLTLPYLKMFLGALNNFSGQIPVSLANASRLSHIDFSSNSLSGTLPLTFGMLQGLLWVNFENNELGSDLNFLTSFTNCSSLKVLGLNSNQFEGELPNSIANLSTKLQYLGLSYNMIHGRVSSGIGNLVNLTVLSLSYNYLSGYLPDRLVELQKLQELYLGGNIFSGPIPWSFGNLTSLTKVYMEENRLEGRIPPSLGDCRSLLVLKLSSNNLNGSIPKEVISISSLSISLNLSNNFFIGSIPLEVGNLKNLEELDVSENKLTGEIPTTLSQCFTLRRLLMNRNFLQGTIPDSLKSLRGADEMDFSRNNLSGEIPSFLGKLPLLQKLNLSYNNFEGKVPDKGIFANASAVSIIGNKNLCEGITKLHLPTCYSDHTHSSTSFLARKFVKPVLVVIILSALIFFLTLCYVIRVCKKSHLVASSWKNHQQSCISYAELVESTNRFSEENLIGAGSFGSVYKGLLSSNGKLVAVKVLNLQQPRASKSFMDECQALKCIKHRNLLKIITVCASVDHQGNEFKALVFEFMSNGSLDQWLHPTDLSKSLSFSERLNIVIDVASAVEYLHHHSGTTIIHCDIKPSNVLLDDDMTSHLGDFGLARVLFEASSNISNYQYLSAGLKGTIGYIAPEIGMSGNVSTLCDVYSFGILLLEVFTGKRPTDEAFKDSHNIHSFVALALPEHVTKVIDRSLFVEEEDQEEIDNENEEALEELGKIRAAHSQRGPGIGMMKCLVSILSIGLTCANYVPGDRMHIDSVVKKLNAIRESFHKFNRRDRNK